MIRPLQTWILFGLCLALATAAMGWVSLSALRLERAESQARRLALHEENARLALWRLDSTLAPLVAQEGARPYFVYAPFYPAERPYTRMLDEDLPGETRLASPLLTATAPNILVHFQLSPDGEVSSPQVPPDEYRQAAAAYVSADEAHRRVAALEQLRPLLRLDALVAALPAPEQMRTLPPIPPLPPAELVLNQSRAQQQALLPQQQGEHQADAQAQQREQTAPIQQIARQQAMKNSAEFTKRSAYVDNYQQAAGTNQVQQVFQGGVSPVSEGLARPLWVGDVLLVCRRVAVAGGEYVQGCRLDWPALRQSLLRDIADLLPQADLVPVAGTSGDTRDTRMLAALPLRLVAGPVPEDSAPAASPIRVTLLVAWACVLLAAGAVGALLLGAVSLSERRGAFVSAVTHELRTPLTTLRMYTEMLAEGMVRDEAQRRSYFQTLQTEADRLGHLVENVLAYSRIERGRARGHITTLPLRELVDRIRQRLCDRAGQAGMDLRIEAAVDPERPVRADPSAVEQILFNLVDNACKYAVCGPERAIELRIGSENGQGQIRVCDHGPGIAPPEARRLFRPFSKSARDAANSAPGVGLGLALSRRLARDMGGDLRLDSGVCPGACFLLTLPAA